MRYDFRCEYCGVFEARQSLADHTGIHPCPTCSELECKQVIRSAPQPLIEAMADAGCPGAFMVSGDRIEKRHIEAGQAHAYWRDKN